MFLVFLCLSVGSLVYVLWHVWQVLPWASVWRWAAVILCAACFLSMFYVLRGGLDELPLGVASVLYQIATSSLIVLLYLALIFICADLLSLVRLLPAGLLRSNGTTALGICVGMAVLLVWGNIKHHNKVRVPLSLTTEKPLAKDYKIVMMSDLHLGYHHRRGEFAHWVDLVNAEHPDLILIAGDIIDNSIRPLLADGMAEEFRRLQAPVYACLGNHEYYSRVPRARAFYEEAGIHLLVDTCTVIDSTLCIIGRDDRTNAARRPLKELAGQAPKGMYTILLDHQPYHLEQTERLGIDFQLSGHTHHGQVWPISWLTDRMYECAFGPWQRGSTRYYVSSGIGIWGGKFRIGTQSEYIVTTLSRK